ncbi:MAG: hypothetical protein H0X29_08105 [Parachlamydiaceae bacterium]|nr:hypothetical protein [Parachlamydiaceae bacterium]
MVNQDYWFKSSLDLLVHGANEQGEVIPRIRIFLKKQGDLNQRAANGETLLSKARAANLVKVINYLKSQGAESDALIETAQKTCMICLENIHLNARCKEEEERVLKCRHVFHSECIERWVKLKHNCPLCRDHVDVDTLEAPRSEMSAEEILAVPDHVPDHNLQFNQGLTQVRSEILQIRSIRIPDLNEDTPLGRTASRGHSVASSLFGFR